MKFENVLEVGCGTGKNTVWLQTRAAHITAVDLSKDMLEKAKAKVLTSTLGNQVEFILADITENWDFVSTSYDLATFSLVLEHVENIGSIFSKLKSVIKATGYIYIGELHPYKQYHGSKARFDTDAGVQVVECYNHHISDFTNAAIQHGFRIVSVNEFFDSEDRSTMPRILTLLLQKLCG